MNRSDIPNQILDRLVYRQDEFRALIDSGEYWKTRWTSLLNQIIGKLGQDLGFGVATREPGFDEGEWLWDHVWYEMSELSQNEMYAMKSIPLVLESEISAMDWGSFKVDFDKLLIASGSQKVFVTRDFGAKDPSLSIGSKLSYAQHAINQYESDTPVHVITWHEKKSDQMINEFSMEYIIKQSNKVNG